MKKNIALTGIMPGSYMNWFITSNVNDLIQITLKDEKRVYLKEERQSKSMAVPVMQSYTDVTGTDLQIEIESDALEVTTTASDILSSDGVKQGRNYIFCCKLSGNFSDAFIQVSVWKNATPGFAGDELIMNLFYQYLILKDKYLVNYINDLYIKEICSSYDTDVVGNDGNVADWYAGKSKEVTDEVEKYKLILATLMKYESHYASTPLTYREWADMVMAFGDKRWGESKITMESCPFRYIRGIILNKAERENFNTCHKELGDTSFFGKEMILAASHATKRAKLVSKRTRLLNFRNCGLYVFSEPENVQDEIINNSIRYAVEKKAEILIFPELSINEDKIPNLIDALNTQSGDLKLVMGGSYYKKGDDEYEYRNSSPILYKKNSEWGILTYYDKMIPFTMGKMSETEEPPAINNIDPKDYDLLVEDIQLSPNITVLPCKDGVIGVAICRDVMDLADKHNPIHQYCDFVDLMLVISDNNGDSNMFTGTAECLARWHNCATLYTNSVAETGIKEEEKDDKLEVSFAIYPFKGGSGSTSLSGVITYISNPFESVQLQSSFEKGMVGILYSKGIKYEGLTKEELDACCKTYVIK